MGDEEFVRRMQASVETIPADSNIPRPHRRTPAPAIEQIARQHPNRDDAILAAYRTGQYSYQEIGDVFGLHFTTVGKIVRNGLKRGVPVVGLG